MASARVPSCTISTLPSYPLGRARNQFAHTVDVFRCRSPPAHPRESRWIITWLGGLGGDAAHLLQRDLRALPTHGDLAGHPVELRGELLLLLGVEVLPRSGDHRLFDVAVQRFFIEVAIAGDGVDAADELFGISWRVSGMI